MILKRAGRQREDLGLTLIELLLSITLLLLLIGAAVYSFAPLQRNRQLDEGLTRLEALFGFARARAAASGTPVYLVLEASTNEVSPGATVQVQWEPDPVNQPGLYTNLVMQPSLSDAVNELVSVELHDEEETGLEDVESLLMSPDNPDILGENLEEEAFEALDDDRAAAEAGDNTLARFAFFPDGSSESAKLVVASRDEADERRFLVELVGLTGSVLRQLVGTNGLPILEGAELEPDVLGSEFDDPLMTNSEPTMLIQ